MQKIAAAYENRARAKNGLPSFCFVSLRCCCCCRSSRSYRTYRARTEGHEPQSASDETNDTKKNCKFLRIDYDCLMGFGFWHTQNHAHTCMYHIHAQFEIESIIIEDLISNVIFSCSPIVAWMEKNIKRDYARTPHRKSKYLSMER